MLAATPPVPTFTQHAIVRRAPSYAYVPARVPLGYRYLRWTYRDTVLRIWFRNPAGKEITFIASARHGACTTGREKTFQQAGNKVYWSHTANEQQAWRCVTGPGDRLVQLTAATAQPPTEFADVGLGRVAASAHRIPVR